MGSQEVPERRRSLRQGLLLQALVFVSLVTSLAVRVDNGDWTPWGVIIALVLALCVGYMAHLAYQLWKLGGQRD